MTASRPALRAGLAAALLALGARPCAAAAIDWTGGCNGNWYNAACWSPAQVPTSVDTVTINLDGANVLVAASSPSISFASMTLGNASGSSAVSLTLSTTIAAPGSLTINKAAGLTSATTAQHVLAGVVMLSGSSMTHTANAVANSQTTRLKLYVTGSFDLQAGATITVDRQGYPGGARSAAPVYSGSGPGGGNCDQDEAGCGGGGHGGAGGAGNVHGHQHPGGGTNGSYSDPTDHGSGGGGYQATGGDGGGAVLLSAGSAFALNGVISADGGAGAECWGTGGGAGGSINISAASLSGSGTLSADGGIGDQGSCGGGAYYGGGGGGGRIRISADSYAFAGTLSTYTAGGAGSGDTSVAGSNGTVYTLTQWESFAWVNASQPSFTASGTSPFRFQLARDAAMAQLIADSVTANAFYVSTNVLTNATTYYWRVRDDDPVGAWSATSRFTVDLGLPAYSGAEVSTNAATGPWTSLPQTTYLSSNTVAARITVSDTVAGLLVSTGPPDGLVGQWHFDESLGGYALDATTQAGRGSIVGPTWTTGRHGAALSFDGVNDYAQIPHSTALSPASQVTVSAWIKTSGSNDYSNIVKKYHNTNFTGYELALHTGGLARADLGNGAAYIIALNPRTVEDGAWHFLAVTYDGAQAVLYVDGIPGTPASGTGYMTANTEPLIIGKDPNLGARFFNGAIDEVRVWNVARSSSQILADYQSDTLAAHNRSQTFGVLYSTNAGTTWNYVSTASVTLGGVNGGTSAQTLQAANIPLVDLTVGASVNRIAFVASDMSGNVSTAAYTVLVDTAPCRTITSVATGLWSASSTWDGGAPPSSCNPVAVASAHTVTVDVMTAASSNTVVSGTVKASRAASSSWTLTQGDLTVNAGGALDYGSEADPIPSAVNAHLILSSGAAAGQYGLIVQSGGDFTVRGSTKTPYSYATQSLTTAQTSLTLYGSSSTLGWQTGDLLTIGPTSGNGTATTSSRTIAGIDGSGAPVYVVNWDGGALPSARVLTATSPIVVANLTRNVLVRSSDAVNNAYLKTLTRNTTSFVLTHGEFAYLSSVAFDDAAGAAGAGAITSSTIRNGANGIVLIKASGVFNSYLSLTGNNVYANSGVGVSLQYYSYVTLSGNNVYANSSSGISLNNSARNTLAGNIIYSNASHGISATPTCPNNTLSGNYSYSNSGIGISLAHNFGGGNSNSNTLTGNNVYANSSHGIRLLDSFSNSVAGNNVYSNALSGISLNNSSNNTLAGNNVFSNSSYGIDLATASANVFLGGGLGYDSSGASRPDASAEAAFNAGSAQTLTLKAARVNPALGVSVSGMNTAGTSLLSYNQDYATGTVRLWGHYQLSGSTFTLDYSSQSYASAATTPKLMRGGGSAGVVATSDANAVSQLVTIRYDASVPNYRVEGSSSGLLGTFTGSIVNQPFPASNPQFYLTYTAGGSPRDGDIVDFVLSAASNDANLQKSLLFGPSSSTYNNGRSKLEVDSTGGIVLRGKSDGTAHTLIDRFASGSTYYTFVDSGAFTAAFSSFTNMDPGGLQLSGTKGVSLSSSTFDYLGFASGTNTYITARDLTANAIFREVTFGLSRSSTGYDSAYNVRVEGADADLRLIFRKTPPSLGPLWGEDYDDDPDNRIVWGRRLKVIVIR